MGNHSSKACQPKVACGGATLCTTPPRITSGLRVNVLAWGWGLRIWGFEVRVRGLGFRVGILVFGVSFVRL